MTLIRLKTTPVVLIEDDACNNIIPLVLELVPQERTPLNLFCYEHSPSVWENVLQGYSHIRYHEEYDSEQYAHYTNTKTVVLVDSVNQMSLCMGWPECLKNLMTLMSDPNVEKIILILHKDSVNFSSKLQNHLNHICTAIVTFHSQPPGKISVKIKKGNKVMRSEETLFYDVKTATLKLIPIVKEEKREEEVDKSLPGNLTTFKIEVDQTDKIQKYKLQLPYMSKIHEGESKVYYEPDAVDDWDEEDPDEDLDI